LGRPGLSAGIIADRKKEAIIAAKRIFFGYGKKPP
jgi:hypothetical protein